MLLGSVPKTALLPQEEPSGELTRVKVGLPNSLEAGWAVAVECEIVEGVAVVVRSEDQAQEG